MRGEVWGMRYGVSGLEGVVSGEALGLKEEVWSVNILSCCSGPASPSLERPGGDAAAPITSRQLTYLIPHTSHLIPHTPYLTPFIKARP
jgi:hypothetical protein